LLETWEERDAKGNIKQLWYAVNFDALDALPAILGKELPPSQVVHTPPSQVVTTPLDNLSIPSSQVVQVKNYKELELQKDLTSSKDKVSKKVADKPLVEIESFDSIISKTYTDSDVVDTFKEFIKMRKLIKKPLTNRALHLIIGKLFGLSLNQVDHVAILEQSIENSWAGVFALKADGNNGNYRGTPKKFSYFDLLEEEQGKNRGRVDVGGDAV
jgi:hypothetical protein